MESAPPESAPPKDVSVVVAADYVATVEIHRPPDNFFDAGLIADLADAYAAAGEQGARAIVLCSEGKNFCAGADFTGRSRARNITGGPHELYEQAMRLFEASLPVIAAVQGAAVGGGLGLACSADFRVAGPGARFSANFARIGLHQGFALTATLPAILGQQHAWNLLYTGRRVSAEEAASIGLADYLADDPRARARELAAEIAGAGPLAVRAIRATMRDGLAARARDAMRREAAEQGKLWATADFAEGVRAFAERRTPNFEGR